MRVRTAAVPDVVEGALRRGVARLPSGVWLCLIPLGVFYAAMHWPSGRISHIMAAIVAVGILSWAVRRPLGALVTLVIFLPLQPLLFGGLLRLGASVTGLRPAGGLKELLGAGILLSALHELYQARKRPGPGPRLDGIDKALLIYVGVATVYLGVPHLFSLLPINDQLTARLLSWRADCGYVLLFFAVRHAPLPPNAKERFVRTLLAMVALTVVVGFFEWGWPHAWSHFVLVTDGQVAYQQAVLHNSPATVSRNLGYLLNRHPLRVGSIFLGPFDMADFLLVGLAITVERITHDLRARWPYVLCAGIVAMLFASRVRADALAVVIMVVVALVPAPERPVAARLRLLGAILLAAVVVIPSLGGTRFVNAQGGSQSNRGHVTEFRVGVEQLLHFPLGLGIGNVAGVGDRFVLGAHAQGNFTVDNAVLQVGDELGVQALVPWLIMVVLVWRALGRAARSTDPFGGGVRLAFLAIFIAGMYHHVFLGFALPWVLWAAVGLAIHEGAGGPIGVGNRGQVTSTCSPPPRVAGQVEDTMELRRYFLLLRPRLAFIILCLVAGVAGGYLVTNRASVYTASSSIYVGSREPNGLTSTDIIQLDRIIATYAAMVRSSPVAAGAVQAAHAPRSAGQVEAETSSVVVPNTNLIAIAVSDTDPAVAQSLANAVATSFIAQAQNLAANSGASADSAPSVTLFQHAGRPSTATATSWKRNAALGGLFGLTVSIGVVLLMDYLDVSIKGADDVEARADIPVLGSVPLHRTGAGESLPTAP